MLNFAIVWEYRCSPQKWMQFDNGLSVLLSGHSRDANGCEFDLSGQKMQFDFRQMRLLESNGRIVRDIRCALRPIGEGVKQRFIWSYYLGPTKRWVNFPMDLSLNLEEQFGASDNCQKIVSGQTEELTLNDEKVQFDWQSKKMTILNTGQQRTFRRVASKAMPSNQSHSSLSIRRSLLPIRSGKRRHSIDNEEEANGNEGNVICSEKENQLMGKSECKTDEIEKKMTIKKQKKMQEEKLKKVNEINNKQSEVNVMKQSAEVDIECRQLRWTASVFVDDKGHCYDVMLNQTNIQQNNNKFYLMQLLYAVTAKNPFLVWFRWGRVGFKGQTNLVHFASLDGALAVFHNKFFEKTRNDFLTSSKNFQKIYGRYDIVRIDYARKTFEKDENKVKAQQNVSSINKMDERVRKLLNTICDLKAMENEARKLEYDFKRIPLGKITEEQLYFGYEALNRIECHIQKGKFGKEFVEAMNDYYTRIPHSFGMRTPPPINSPEDLKRESELLEILTGIEIIVSHIGTDSLECHYARLRWDLTPLEEDNANYKIVEEYLRETHGPTHDQYQLKLRNVFELQAKNTDEGTRNAKRIATRKKIDIGNHKLLWHGSRLANWYSILAQGLRIAPPEAPSTGFMFGKGVYFADISSKSANYSLSEPNKPGFLLLCAVALGEVVELKEADLKMHQKLPAGKNSVKGIGRFVPQPKERRIIDGDVEVPIGKPIKNDDDAEDESSLIYNEFVVYNLETACQDRILSDLGDMLTIYLMNAELVQQNGSSPGAFFG